MKEQFLKEMVNVNGVNYTISSWNGDVKLMANFLNQISELLNELYAFRMLEYSKTFKSFIQKGKHEIFASKEAEKRVKNFDDIINKIVINS